MDDSRVFTASRVNSQRAAGIISRIKVENFMCHSSLQIEFGEWVNFITGQNGSGKSAILTALCVAFGCRARGTQRASTLKDFIKTGCSHAVVVVELINKGEDAFKPEIYGELIVIERRITESTSSIVLKDHQGKKVAQRKGELLEMIEHFNIDVENPCVIMSQDKSREFLHSGNDKEKFKFFFKATLLQQVNDLLQNIRCQLDSASAAVDELEQSIRPILKDLSELQVKIKNMEHVEEISQQAQQLKKKLAWAWVYDVDRQILDQLSKIEKYKDRIPTCQSMIDQQLVKIGDLQNKLVQKKAHISSMVDRTSEVRRMKDDLQQDLSLATKEKLELEEEHSRGITMIRKMTIRIQRLEQQIHDIKEQHFKDTQAEEFEIKEHLESIKGEVEAAESNLRRLKEEENLLNEKISMAEREIKEISMDIEENERRYREVSSHIRDLKQHEINKVTAFGGERVLNLLRSIERHHRKFKCSPIGPIGAHMTLIHDDTWAPAVEYAIGKLLNAFIVTNHKDFHLLRSCAKEANYLNLQIFIYDFSKPLLHIPSHMLPQTNHPTTLSVIHTDNPTIRNVLVDMGHAERQVLVRDYEVGKLVAFEQRIQNLKEVFTLEGYKMFSRGSVQTILPPNKKMRTARLCRSIHDQITIFEKDASLAKEYAQQGIGRKRNVEKTRSNLENEAKDVKRRRMNEERDLMSKKLKMRDLTSSQVVDANLGQPPDMDVLCQEILKIQEEIQEKKKSLERVKVTMNEADSRTHHLKSSFEDLCESAKEEIDVFEQAERELLVIEEELHSVEAEKVHYEGVMKNKVLLDVKNAEAAYEELKNERKESSKKASIICPESEVEALGGCAGATPEKLSAQLNRILQRLQHESQRYDESIADLRALHEKKQRKIIKKQQMYDDFRGKLQACQKALDLRWNKFQRNATLLKRQLTWQFNGHLRKKGISGHIKVDYEQKTLSIEVKMPQDASTNAVRDTRGLSGGERSFSTLCFALALHEMTEAPFRAMDEFDVFMDAVSRKISLDTLIDFAVAEGSQWILITPHDISMVKGGDKIKKQQMAAPRS